MSSPLSRIRRGLSGAEYRSSTLANPDEWMFEAFGAQESWAGQTVTTTKALQVPAVRGAISLISWAVSLCPLKVYRDAEDGTPEAEPNHRAWPMLHDKPNEHIPADTYWQLATRQLLRYGNHFSEKRRNMLTGLVDELRPMPANTRVEINWATYEKRYIVDYPDERGRQVFGPNDVLHVMGDTDDGIVGVSPLFDCKEAIGTALARMVFEGSFYRRGAVFSGVIEHPNKLGSLKAIDRLKRAFSAKYEGSKNAHGTPVLEEGAKFNRTGAPLSELEFNESERRTRTDIAILFNLPSGFLAGDTGESLKYATVEGNQIQFAQFAVAPWANRIAKTISADTSIFPFQSWYAEFVLEGLMRGDMAGRAGVYTQLFGIVDEEGRRALDVNEIRAMENRRPARAKPKPEPAAIPAPAEDEDGTVDGEQPVLKVAALRG